MHRPNDNPKVTGALRWLLHYFADALESRLADRVDRWMQRLQRHGKERKSWND
jgi:hypothetical protein